MGRRRAVSSAAALPAAELWWGRRSPRARVLRRRGIWFRFAQSRTADVWLSATAPAGSPNDVVFIPASQPVENVDGWSGVRPPDNHDRAVGDRSRNPSERRRRVGRRIVHELFRVQSGRPSVVRPWIRGVSSRVQPGESEAFGAGRWCAWIAAVESPGLAVRWRRRSPEPAGRWWRRPVRPMETVPIKDLRTITTTTAVAGTIAVATDLRRRR